jgi:3-isopropylmalate/(R)-2-methylmalate dehydratase small subunit
MNEILKIQGKAVPLAGDDIDTDRIIPARFMKCLTFDGLGEYAFYDVRFNDDGSEKDHPLNKEIYQGHSILVSNRNFGCGSSREHAPWALYGIGIRAIIAQSYAEIFAGNCSSLGIPTVIVSPEICQKIQGLIEENPSMDWEIDLISCTIKSEKETFEFTMAETYRQGLIRGEWDTTGVLLESLDLVEAKNKELPSFIR